MTTISATDFSRNMSRLLDRLEHGGEEFLIVRNHHAVARLVPGAPEMRALDAFSDLFGVLPDTEGAEWTKDMSTFDRPSAQELKDPWA
jgi:antitoxin (DNA-binding transcriptional repressor) of toxin-antitoxin stability system